MLTLKLLREQPDFVIERLAVKNFDAKEIVDSILKIDEQRRATQTELDANLAKQNAAAKTIGGFVKEGKKDEAEKAKQEVAQLKAHSDELQKNLDDLNKQQLDQLVLLPNLPCKDVPAGKDANDNVVVKMGGKIPELPADAKPHWELAKSLNIIDFDLGVKLTGAGFPVYIGKGSKIQRALISFFLDRNTKDGYTEVQPPLVVNEASAFATGQLPDKSEQMYYVGLDKFYMIPTAEVPVTNIYRDCIVAKKDFPIKMTAYTQCFRREAGSYGKDVRGLNRLHQFDKVEIVQLSLPDVSYKALDGMVEHVEKLVQELELPYRIVRLCGGDMSFTSAITYDFEVFSAAQKRWLEVSSVSNFETYQANRMKLRFKDDDGKIKLAHTLNGSSLALPRILAALIENNQTPDGKIKIPKALQEFTGFDIIG
ncbi:MAG: serine--tRNA ligase [Bacteroidales bacterium]|jgi:seryl-tRNA synthetase|nr:serine--tRNA ligase [Bacteroidales bacterium]MDD4420901.1 serine--tRNA ligase [Bacteroidales bacterium]